MSITMTEEALLSTAELCDKIGVTRQAIYKWRNLEEDPMPVAIDNSSRGGKTIRYLYSDVMEWLNGRRKR